MVKKVVLMAALVAGILLGEQVASAQVHVRGHYRSNGHYVQPHYRTYPDHNFHNNWSTYPNVNPYTGQVGHRHTPPQSWHYAVPADIPADVTSYTPTSGGFTLIHIPGAPRRLVWQP